MHFARISALALLFALPACRQSPPDSDTNPQTTASTPTKTPARIPANSAHALAAEAYIELGLPSPERNWTSTDYESAAKAIQKLAATDPGALPRLRGSSKPFFDRMIDERNLELLSSKQTPLAVRLNLVSGTMHGLGTLMTTYLNRTLAGAPLLRETLSLQVFSIVVGAIQWDNVDDLIPTLDKNAPDYATRMSGLDMVRSGSNDMVFGSLVTLAGLPEAKDKIWFARKLQVAVPPLLVRLSDLNAKDAIGKATKLRDEQQDPEVRKALDDLAEALQNASRPDAG